VSTAGANPGSGRFGLVGKRVVVGLMVGIVAAAVALVEGASWAVAALCASDFAALVFIVWVWITVAGADAAKTARLARAEDASRAAAEAVLIGAGGASLIAVAFTLVQAGSAHAPARGLLSALAIGSVALAWTSIHTVYVLRYARSYYSPPDGGIDFHGEMPDYLDFAYLALTIGMCFQVSDTDLTGKRVRRCALHHALLSYIFGTVIVAVTVNLIAALLGHQQLDSGIRARRTEPGAERLDKSRLDRRGPTASRGARSLPFRALALYVARLLERLLVGVEEERQHVRLGHRLPCGLSSEHLTAELDVRLAKRGG
jgi:uncharacterized membrane protein